MNATVISIIAPVIDLFVQNKISSVGGSNKIQSMVKAKVGVEITHGQAHSIRILKKAETYSISASSAYSLYLWQLWNEGNKTSATSWRHVCRSTCRSTNFVVCLSCPQVSSKIGLHENGLISFDATFLTGITKGVKLLANW